jgi:hypothetical protein
MTLLLKQLVMYMTNRLEEAVIRLQMACVVEDDLLPQIAHMPEAFGYLPARAVHGKKLPEFCPILSQR